VEPDPYSSVGITKDDTPLRGLETRREEKKRAQEVFKLKWAKKKD
jgi:hypothetical protein